MMPLLWFLAGAGAVASTDKIKEKLAELGRKTSTSANTTSSTVTGTVSTPTMLDRLCPVDDHMPDDGKDVVRSVWARRDENELRRFLSDVETRQRFPVACGSIALQLSDVVASKRKEPTASNGNGAKKPEPKVHQAEIVVEAKEAGDA